MPITSLDTLLAAMAGNAGAPAQIVPINKASLATMTSGRPASLWNATGTPGAGGAPTTAAICDAGTAGRLPIANAGVGRKLHAANMTLITSATAPLLEIHDRLGHMGGLNGTLTTAQTVNLDISGTASNLAARRGAADYSEVQWWLEIYTALGATAVNYTVTYTRADGTVGQTTAQFEQIGGTDRLAAGRLIPIITSNGALIRRVESITLAASTLTAGNFGVTATRRILGMGSPTANLARDGDYATLGLPEIPEASCLAAILYCTATSTGTVTANLRVVEG